MSIIMDALEKAQRDKDRKKGEVTEESLLHPAKVFRSSSAGKYFLVILLSNLAVILIIAGVFIYRKTGEDGAGERREATHVEKEEALPVKEVKEVVSTAEIKREETAVSEKMTASLSSKTIYHEELVLENGLRLKVDGVYLDGGIPYALIGPDIVKSGDVIEGVVNVLHIDFKKVEINYKGKNMFLLAQ